MGPGNSYAGMTLYDEIYPESGAIYIKSLDINFICGDIHGQSYKIQ